jgi:large subunit ribosomal protein L6
MSRIGKKPVEIPQGVKVDQQGQTVKVSGPLGALDFQYDPRVGEVDASQHKVEVASGGRPQKSRAAPAPRVP